MFVKPRKKDGDDEDTDTMSLQELPDLVQIAESQFARSNAQDDDCTCASLANQSPYNEFSSKRQSETEIRSH